MKKRLVKRTVSKPVPEVAAVQPRIPTITKATGCDHCGAYFKDPEKLQKHLDNSRCGELLGANGSRGRKFTSVQVDVPNATQAQQKARVEAVVVIGQEQKTAIEIRRSEGLVTYIPHSLSGLAVERLSAKEFDAAWKPQADYPTGRAAKLYVGYALDIGGTSEAMTELETLVDVTEKEKQMAVTKLAGNKTTNTVLKTVNAGKQGKVKVEGTSKPKNSAASMFKGLILEGKLTDDEIFTKVQATFNLDDSKRTYVAWYRNALKKDGQNPPAPKGEAPTAPTQKPAVAGTKKIKAA